MEVKNVIIIILVFALIITGGILLSTLAKQETAPPPPPPLVPAPEEVPPPAVPQPPVLTKAHFDQLLYGMTYRQAADTLGSEGGDVEKEYKRGAGPYEETKLILWYNWENPDGSGVRAGFVNDQLVDKIESGLE